MAQDLTLKKRALTASAIQWAMKFMELYDSGPALKDEKYRSQLDFNDNDLMVAGLQHLTPYMINNFLDNVIPAIITALDAANVKDALRQMRT